MLRRRLVNKNNSVCLGRAGCHEHSDDSWELPISIWVAVSRAGNFFSPASWKLGGLTRHIFGGGPESNLPLSVSLSWHIYPSLFWPVERGAAADFQRTRVSGSWSFTVVFVALSHYFSDCGNVLALSSINPSPRGCWIHDIWIFLLY